MRLIPGAISISKYQPWQFPWGTQNMDVEPSSCMPAYLELLNSKELMHVDICLKAFNIHVLQFWIFWITPEHRRHLILSHRDFFTNHKQGNLHNLNMNIFNNESAHTPISWHQPDHSIQMTVYSLVVLDSDLTGKVLTQRSQFYRNNVLYVYNSKAVTAHCITPVSLVWFTEVWCSWSPRSKCGCNHGNCTMSSQRLIGHESSISRS